MPDLVAVSPVYETCLLYTSDAADERSSVDLGGRRIIKKKTRDERTGIEEGRQRRTKKNNHETQVRKKPDKGSMKE